MKLSVGERGYKDPQRVMASVGARGSLCTTFPAKADKLSKPFLFFKLLKSAFNIEREHLTVPISGNGFHRQPFY
jgi:hypothetical protein